MEGAYGYPLRKVFLPWCEREGVTEPSALTIRVLERYQDDLLTKGGARGPLSKASVHAYVRVVNQMVSWARSDPYMDAKLPNCKVKLPKLGRPVKNILTREEILLLEDTAKAERDKLIVRVFGETGIRVGELLKLRFEDLVIQDRKRYLHVQGKGQLDRLVPIVDPTLWRRLERFVKRRPDKISGSRLFLGLKRRAGHDQLEPLTESGVQQMIRVLAHNAGLTKRVHPHLFRYSAATWMRRKGLDPLTIARVMGWTSLRMLQDIYDQSVSADDYDAMWRQLRSSDD
ncbi:MAG: tyrosine-type recombinase/integrase [Candidatus Dormibacteraceae bacterium]